MDIIFDQTKVPKSLTGLPNVAQTTAGGFGAREAAATDWAENPNQSSANQLRGIIATGSPLFEQAKAEGLADAGRRGLPNTSIATTSALSALYKAATPFAQQDANTEAERGKFNANQRTSVDVNNAQMTNAARQFTAGEENKALALTAEARNRQLATDVADQNKLIGTGYQGSIASEAQQRDIAAQKELQVSKEAHDKVMANIDLTNKKELNSLEYNNQRVLQSSQAGSELYKQFIASMATLYSTPNMSQGAKDKVATEQMNNLKNSVSLLSNMSGIEDLSKFIKISPLAPGSTTAVGSAEIAAKPVSTMTYNDWLIAGGEPDAPTFNKTKAQTFERWIKEGNPQDYDLYNRRGLAK